tara:strand:- start:306 stop:473 length:168 start_codon:yes stop_codon:yes gene_type:complete
LQLISILLLIGLMSITLPMVDGFVGALHELIEEFFVGLALLLLIPLLLRESSIRN